MRAHPRARAAAVRDAGDALRHELDGLGQRHARDAAANDGLVGIQQPRDAHAAKNLDRVPHKARRRRPRLLLAVVHLAAHDAAVGDGGDAGTRGRVAQTPVEQIDDARRRLAHERNRRRNCSVAARDDAADARGGSVVVHLVAAAAAAAGVPQLLVGRDADCLLYDSYSSGVSLLAKSSEERRPVARVEAAQLELERRVERRQQLGDPPGAELLAEFLQSNGTSGIFESQRRRHGR